MNKFQKTLGAIALSLGIATNSALSDETKATTTTTQNGVATALATKDDTNNNGKIKQVNYQAPKLDISKLTFPKDLKVLLEEAKKLNVEVEKIDDEKKFETLKKQITPLTEEKIKALKFENKEDVEKLKIEMGRYGIEGEIVSKGKFVLYRQKVVVEAIKANTEKNMQEAREKAKRAAEILEAKVANAKNN